MVLATDGGPDCNADLDPGSCRCVGGNCNQATRCLDDTRTIARITTFAGQGIPTYVMGISSAGDDTNADVLDAMAIAGGRPQTQVGASHRYYAATSGAELSSALVAIRNQVGACTYLTRSVPGSQGTITVTVGGTVVPYDATGATGSRWADRTNGEIAFASEPCAQVASTTVAPTVDVSCAPAAEAGADAADAASDGLDASEAGPAEDAAADP